MTGEQALWALFGAAALVAIGGVMRYGTLLNPLTVSTVMDTGMTTLLTGVFAYHFVFLGKYSDADIAKTAALSGVYLLGITVPYLLRGRRLAHAFGFGMQLLQLRSPRIAARFSPVKFAILLACAAAMFAALAVSGGGGALWLTNPRAAYISYRTGAGQFWLLTDWFLIMALLYYLWAKRPRGMHLGAVVVAFTIGAYFVGSKAVILTIVVIGLAYYHFMVRELRTYVLVACGVVGITAFVGLLFFQGSYSDWAGVASYFENFQITAQFLARFKEFGYQYGGAWLSSFWFYVPRVLYPGKPLEYGPILIQKVLLPGAYEAGYAPGFLTWSLSYLDFGWIGVFVAGWLKGTIECAAYEHFLDHKNSLFAFALMMQISLWGVFAFASASTAIVWCVVQAVFLRMVLVHRTLPSLGQAKLREYGG